MIGLLVSGLCNAGGREEGVSSSKTSQSPVWPGRKAKIKNRAGGKEGKAPFSLYGAYVYDPV